MRSYKRLNPGEELTSLKAERICLIKPSALGDVVQALPVLTALRERFPSAHIAWVVERGYADLLVEHPHLDELIVFERHHDGGGTESRLAFLRRFARRLRAGRYDLVCDLQGLIRSGMMAAATGASRRIGLSDAREGARWFYTHQVHVPAEVQSAVERYWLVAQALGAAVSPRQFVVPVGDVDQQWARGRLTAAAGTRVAIHPGARWETKRWPAEHFAEIVRRLVREFTLGCVLVGSAADREAAQQIAAAAPGHCVNLVGRTSLKQLAAVLTQVELLLTGDSGPMHLAAALGTPVVALFTCTSPERAGPLGARHVVIPTSLWCAASYLKRCARLECMRELTPDRVWPLVREKLRSTSQALAGCA